MIVREAKVQEPHATQRAQEKQVETERAGNSSWHTACLNVVQDRETVRMVHIQRATAK